MANRKKLHLSKNLSFGTDIITEVIDIIAKRGAGKTYTAMKIAEEMLIIGAQIVVVDPVGNWYGLRLGANGKSDDGLDIKILGGLNGDIPLEHTAGALIAKTIVETGMSAILDLSLMSKLRQQRFITDFASSMLEFRKRDPSAMHIFWEEAYRFMPQKMTKGSKSEMLEASEELVTMGRNFGIGGTIICQRSAQISKTVLTQASILIAMNTTGLVDKKVIRDWMDVRQFDGDNSLSELSKLAKGEAFVWWPEEFGIKRVQVSKKRTYDASSTPKFGQKTRKRKLKAIDLAALEISMAETIEKAKNEDPRILRRKLATAEKEALYLSKERHRLETELAKAKGAIREEIVHVEVPVLDDDMESALKSAVKDITHVLREITSAIGGLPDELPTVLAPHSKSRVSPRAVSERSYIEESHPVPVDLKLAKGAVGMLKALAAIHPGGLTKKQVALAAGLKSSGGTFGTYWSKLNVLSFIEGGYGLFRVTDVGLAFLGDDIPVQPTTPEEKLEFWCQRMPGRSKDMLRILFKNRGAIFTKPEIGAELAMQHTGGTFGTYLSKLTANGLVEKRSGGYAISEDMFS